MTAATNNKDLPDVLGEIIDTAIALTEADFGNIQLLDLDGNLRIFVHRGFPDWWIEFWNTVTPGHGVCGSSLAAGERIIVEDVEQSPIFVGTPALDIQRKAGVRAVQSTPLRDRAGQVLGMLSTHYRSPYRPDPKSLKVLDLLAAHAATLVERMHMEEGLRENEVQLRLMLQGGPIILAKVDHDLRYQWIYNLHPAFRLEDVIGRRDDEIADTAGTRRLTALKRDVINSGKPAREEIAFQFPEGERIWDMIIEPLTSENGTIIGAYTAAFDITERKQAEDDLKASEDRFRLIAETITEVFWIADVEIGKMYYISPTYEHIWGRSLQSLNENPRSFIEAIHPEDVARVLADFELKKTGQPIDHEYRIFRPDGTLRWIWDRGFPIHEPTGEVLRYVGIAQDNTERKKLENELRESNKLLRKLSEKAEKLREEERKRIAREVHDELGQTLTALRMDVALISLRFGALDAELLAKTERMTALLDQAGWCVRDIVSNLRPTALDMGIVAAVKWLCSEYATHTGSACVLHTDEESIELDENRAVGLFRIVQELLTNAARHAEASNVKITLARHDDDLHIQVRDNGKGFDPAVAASKRTFGLLGISERAIALNGDVDIVSAPDQGTSVFVRVPTKPKRSRK